MPANNLAHTNYTTRVIPPPPRGSFAFPGGNRCRFPGCGRVFANGFARRRHERRAHDPLDWPGLSEADARRLVVARLRELAAPDGEART